VVRVQGIESVNVVSGRRRLKLLETLDPRREWEEKVMALFQLDRRFPLPAGRKGSLTCPKEDGGTAAPAAGVNRGEQLAKRVHDVFKGWISVAKIHGKQSTFTEAAAA